MIDKLAHGFADMHDVRDIHILVKVVGNLSSRNSLYRNRDESGLLVILRIAR